MSPGPGQGEVVGVVLPAGPGVVATLGSLWDREAVPAILDPGWGDAEVSRAIEALRPGWVITDAAKPAVRAAEHPRSRPLAPGDGAGAAPHADRPAAIVWTSGSSGSPRAILLTAANLDASADATRSLLGLRQADRWALTLSPAHVGGLAMIWRARRVGCDLVADGPFDVDRFLSRIERGEVTHASLVPVMLRRVLEHPDLPGDPGLRAVLVGGAHVGSALLAEAMARGIPVAPTYGMTEATSQVATATPELARTKPGTVGPPLEGVGVRIVDGEIQVRGPTIARRLDLAAPTPMPGGPLPTQPLAAADGWYSTGDLGSLDADGHLTVSGRLGDRIISGGVNVDPVEVEAALVELSAVRDAVVLGLPDREWGERVVAVLVARDGSEMTLDSIRGELRDDLAPAKLPRQIVRVDRIPRNANGKVDREAVRAALPAEGQQVR